MANILPAAGEMSDSATPLVYQGRFEDWLAGTKNALGASTNMLVSISGGLVDPPARASVLIVDTEGGTATDDLNEINEQVYFYPGAIILVRNTDNARAVVVKHDATGGSGRILLANDSDFSLNAIDKFLLLWRDNTVWREIGRCYGSAINLQRSDLGLGSAATFDVGPGNGLNADLLDGKHAADFVEVGEPVADSSQLGGVPAASYARKDSAAGGQTFDNVVTADAGLLQVNRDTAGGQTIIDLQQGGVAQGRIFYDDATSRLYLTGPAGLAGELVFLDFNDGLFYLNKGQATGNYALRSTEDKIPTSDLTIQTNTSTGSLAPNTEVVIGINRRAFFPSVQIEGNIRSEVGHSSSNLASPKIRLSRGSGSGIDDYDLDWEYLA